MLRSANINIARSRAHMPHDNACLCIFLCIKYLDQPQPTCRHAHALKGFLLPSLRPYAPEYERGISTRVSRMEADAVTFYAECATSGGGLGNENALCLLMRDTSKAEVSLQRAESQSRNAILR
jgi:hypothetical protein